MLVTGAAGGEAASPWSWARRAGCAWWPSRGRAGEELVRRLGAESFMPRDVPDLAAAVRAVVPGGVAGAVDVALLGVTAQAAVRNRGAFVAVTGGAPLPLRGIRVVTEWIATDPAALAELSGLAGTDRLTARVAETLPLAAAARAHERLAKGGPRGVWRWCRSVAASAPASPAAGQAES
ncbi:zinc-binding dehydrogenase [Streptomyces sp. URMC 129]|uniref:zinc-binding dehydrogenase n=1 Tax=Streptomyces sp. URMC 129 TaxID=3423407 RepID=UPI003F1C5900